MKKQVAAGIAAAGIAAMIFAGSAWADEKTILSQTPQYTYSTASLIDQDAYPEVVLTPWYESDLFTDYEPKERLFLYFPAAPQAVASEFEHDTAVCLDTENLIQYNYQIYANADYDDFTEQAPDPSYVIADGSEGSAAYIDPDGLSACGVLPVTDLGENAKLCVQMRMNGLDTKMSVDERTAKLKAAVTNELQRLGSKMHCEKADMYWSTGKYQGVSMLEQSTYDFACEFDFPELSSDTGTYSGSIETLNISSSTVLYLASSDTLTGYEVQYTLGNSYAVDFANQYPDDAKQLMLDDGTVWTTYVYDFTAQKYGLQFDASYDLGYKNDYGEDVYANVSVRTLDYTHYTDWDQVQADLNRFASGLITVTDQKNGSASQTAGTDAPVQAETPAAVQTETSAAGSTAAQDAGSSETSAPETGVSGETGGTVSEEDQAAQLQQQIDALQKQLDNMNNGEGTSEGQTSSSETAAEPAAQADTAAEGTTDAAVDPIQAADSAAGSTDEAADAADSTKKAADFGADSILQPTGTEVLTNETVLVGTQNLFVKGASFATEIKAKNAAEDSMTVKAKDGKVFLLVNIDLSAGNAYIPSEVLTGASLLIDGSEMDADQIYAMTDSRDGTNGASYSDRYLAKIEVARETYAGEDLVAAFSLPESMEQTAGPVYFQFTAGGQDYYYEVDLAEALPAGAEKPDSQKSDTQTAAAEAVPESESASEAETEEEQKPGTGAVHIEDSALAENLDIRKFEIPDANSIRFYGSDGTDTVLIIQNRNTVPVSVKTEPEINDSKERDAYSQSLGLAPDAYGIYILPQSLKKYGSLDYSVSASYHLNKLEEAESCISLEPKGVLDDKSEAMYRVTNNGTETLRGVPFRAVNIQDGQLKDTGSGGTGAEELSPGETDDALIFMNQSIANEKDLVVGIEPRMLSITIAKRISNKEPVVDQGLDPGETYTLCFEPGSMYTGDGFQKAGGTMDDITFKGDTQKLTLPDCTFTMEGAAFAGWTLSDGSAYDNIPDHASFDLTSRSDYLPYYLENEKRSATLTARWQERPEDDHVTVDVEENSFSKDLDVKRYSGISSGNNYFEDWFVITNHGSQPVSIDYSLDINDGTDDSVRSGILMVNVPPAQTCIQQLFSRVDYGSGSIEWKSSYTRKYRLSVSEGYDNTSYVDITLESMAEDSAVFHVKGADGWSGMYSYYILHLQNGKVVDWDAGQIQSGKEDTHTFTPDNSTLQSDKDLIAASDGV